MNKEQHERAKRELGFPMMDEDIRSCQHTYTVIGEMGMMRCWACKFCGKMKTKDLTHPKN